MNEELTAKVGLKHRHDPDRVATRNGTAPGSVVLGGRTVPLRRPWATLTGGGELQLDSYAVFSATDLLTQIAMERMLAGVATRRHALVAEPIGVELEGVARGDSKSAVSRRFKAATEAALAELIGRDLSELDVAAVMIDGISFAECCCVAALVITTDGTKVPVGLRDGDTESGTVVKDLLADLVARGLRYEDGILVVIDGAKALAASNASSASGPWCSVAPCTSAATSPATWTRSWPAPSTVSSPAPSTTPTGSAACASPGASPPNSRTSTPQPRPACAKDSRTCSPSAAWAYPTASPGRCRAPTPSSR